MGKDRVVFSSFAHWNSTSLFTSCPWQHLHVVNLGMVWPPVNPDRSIITLESPQLPLQYSITSSFVDTHSTPSTKNDCFVSVARQQLIRLSFIVCCLIFCQFLFFFSCILCSIYMPILKSRNNIWNRQADKL